MALPVVSLRTVSVAYQFTLAPEGTGVPSPNPQSGTVVRTVHQCNKCHMRCRCCYNLYLISDDSAQPTNYFLFR